MTRTIAVMQPYFVPYAGYFRLMAEVDLFVVYDCVQFTRRGYIHRNQLSTHSGTQDWLTLSLKKAPQDVLIQDLSFSDTVAEEIKKNFSRFPCLKGAEEHPLVNVLSDFSHPPVPYLVRQLEVALEILGISCPMVLSSSLKIPETFKGQDRILEICRILQANRYVNAPSGRDLYEVHAFKKRNIELSFLPLFQGNRVSILERVLTEPAEKIRDEIFKQLKEV